MIVKLAIVQWIATVIFGFSLLQIIPGENIGNSITPYLISAIVAESTAIVFLFMYIKKVNQLKDEAVEKSHQSQVKDQKEVIGTNTKALIDNAHAANAVASATKDVAEAVNDLRLWLVEKIKS